MSNQLVSSLSAASAESNKPNFTVVARGVTANGTRSTLYQVEDQYTQVQASSASVVSVDTRTEESAKKRRQQMMAAAMERWMQGDFSDYLNLKNGKLID